LTNVPALPASRLIERVPAGAPLTDPGAILDRFLAHVAETGLEPYPAQEEALLELAAGKHVVLSTPTGSGKSLVALGLHFKALCEGRRSWYTAPVKALVNEKFFALCDAFGPENVGMLTGDASINWAAPVICATEEVLANVALHQGERSDAPYVVMDEFHFYADRERGWAWQVPLLTLPRTTFLLMSATLGNTAAIEEKLADFTGRAVAHVHRDERPVPLDYEWRETQLHETVEDLLEQGRAPIYVVSFTQREAAEVAGALTSAKVATRAQRDEIAKALAGFRFDTPYGKELKRMVGHGVGLHHAGLLPKYRRLVERLAQQGLLRVVSGTDTLGVGVNIPIRTVLFTGLAKYDGERVRLLSVRDFKQIAGRAGRKGFDERGSVVCQAPEHVAANKAAAAKEARGGKRQPRKTPPPGFVSWTRESFQQLVAKPPETLVSSFAVTHGMILSLLQREPAAAGPRGGYGALGALIARCHESPARKRRLRRDAAVRFRSLRAAGIVHVAGRRAFVDPDLQRDFSLHQTLSLYAVEAIAALDRAAPDYALSVLSVMEAIVEDPVPILRAQVARAKDELIARLKAERVPYEERMAKLEEVSWPKPEAEFVRATFRIFADRHPWVSEQDVRPKAVAREMLEAYEGFDDAVRRLGIQRSEGLLLRYLGEVLRALERSVPDASKTDALHDVLAYLRELVRRTDASLLAEWEARGADGSAPAEVAPPRPAAAPTLTPRAFQARVRAELQALVRALAAGDYEQAAACVRPDPEEPWDAARFAAALAPFLAAHVRVRFDPAARRADQTVLRPLAPLRWSVQHVLPDPEGEDSWFLLGEIDLREAPDPELPLVRLLGIHE
jgi:superfamily II RNA helicase